MSRSNVPTMGDTDLGEDDPYHGSHFSVGITKGKWMVDPDHWWFRDADPDTHKLVQGSINGFYWEGRVFVRSFTHAEMIDKGLRIN